MDTTTIETVETIDEQIRAAAERAGLEFVRVARVRGRASAVFMAWPIPSYGKTLMTDWYDDESELLRTVLDTFENFTGDMMNIFSSEMFQYLVAEMLPTDGRTISMTIKNVDEEKVSSARGDQVKVAITFNERPKRLLLNKTNARTLAKALGLETNDWRGATVTLGVEQIKVGRETVPSIRVKAATPAQRPQPRSRANRPATTPGDDPALRNAPDGDREQDEPFGG